MIKRIYAVFDNAARLYSTPFASLRDEVAMRDFRNAALDPTSDVSRNPHDYTLFFLGTFDDQDGSLSSVSEPTFLITASQFIDNQQ